jgi:hypothetical protein
MHTYTLYNSAFTNNNPNLSPVHHLRCDLKMCKQSIDMLKTNGVIDNIEKFPTELHCVLTEIPEIAFSSKWEQGGSASAVFTPITKMLKDGALGQTIQLLAGKNNIPLVETNEFSQRVMTDNTSRVSLKLKFTIYTDTYNKRYNFTSSPYEKWLRMLYFSTAPIYKATYANLFKVITAMAENVGKNAHRVSQVFETITEGGAALVNSLPIVEKTETALDNHAKLYKNIEELSRLITQYFLQSNKIGHVCWDVIIPQYLHATDDTSSPILWNVENFNVKFSDKFTRGLVSKEADVTQIYRPRPLYANFEVTLTSNQVMTRDQYIRMLFGNSTITKTPASN